MHCGRVVVDVHEWATDTRGALLPSADGDRAPGTPARKPHAVTTVWASIYPVASFAYDCNGNTPALAAQVQV